MTAVGGLKSAKDVKNLTTVKPDESCAPKAREISHRLSCNRVDAVKCMIMESGFGGSSSVKLVEATQPLY